MVKGTSRRIIVVDSPDTELFEQAIFIVRKDALNHDGVTPRQLVNEACRVARSYGREGKRPFFRLATLYWGAAGVGCIAVGWLISTLI